MNKCWIRYTLSVLIAIFLSGFSAYWYDYFYSRGIYSLDNRMSMLTYAGLQFLLLLPLIISLSKKKYVAAIVIGMGFLKGNHLFINPAGEDNLHRSYFEFLFMLATIGASYVIGFAAQFLYSYLKKKVQ